MQEQTVAVTQRDRLGGDDEGLNPSDGGGFYADAERLTNFWQRRYRGERRLVRPRLPLGGGLWRNVKAGIERLGNDCLHLRTDGVRYWNRARWHNAHQIRVHGCDRPPSSGSVGMRVYERVGHHGEDSQHYHPPAAGARSVGSIPVT